MTNKYHISPETGRPNICRAKDGNCPLKTEDGNPAPHYSSKEDARAGYETSQKETGKQFSTVAKKKIDFGLTPEEENKVEQKDKIVEEIDNSIDTLDSNDDEISKREQSEQRKIAREGKILKEAISKEKINSLLDDLEYNVNVFGVSADVETYDNYDDYDDYEDNYDDYDDYGDYEDNYSYSGDVNINRKELVKAFLSRTGNRDAGKENILKTAKIVEKILDEHDMFETWSYEVETNSSSPDYGEIKLCNENIVSSLREAFNSRLD